MLSLDKYHSDECCITCPQNISPKQRLEDGCAVCLEQTSEPDVMLLGCGHTFHSDCILTWVQRNFSCPLCRAECQSFVPINGQTLSPEFAQVWENHFIEKSPEPEPEVIPTKQNKIIETSKSVETPQINETPTIVVHAPEPPQTVATSPLVEAVIEQLLPEMLPYLNQMPEMRVVPKQHWSFDPKLPLLRFSPVYSSFNMAPVYHPPTPFTALVLLESSHVFRSNKINRPIFIRVSTAEAKIAKQRILQNRVFAVSMSRLDSKRMKFRQFSAPAIRKSTPMITSKFHFENRRLHKTNLLHSTFEKRTISRVTSKIQAKMAILL